MFHIRCCALVVGARYLKAILAPDRRFPVVKVRNSPGCLFVEVHCALPRPFHRVTAAGPDSFCIWATILLYIAVEIRCSIFAPVLPQGLDCAVCGLFEACSTLIRENMLHCDHLTCFCPHHRSPDLGRASKCLPVSRHSSCVQLCSG
jgi:hypothetical protein